MSTDNLVTNPGHTGTKPGTQTPWLQCPLTVPFAPSAPWAESSDQTLYPYLFPTSASLMETF